MIGWTPDKHGKQVIGLQFKNSVGKAGKFTVEHQDKGTQNLCLVESRPSGI